MINNDDPEAYRSGFVALIGRPNVGKSTLINTLLGQNIAAVSSKPQTTRKRQLGILTLPHAQLIFMDTPGIHEAHHKLGEALNSAAEYALADADLLLIMFDMSRPPTSDDLNVSQRVLDLNDKPEALVAFNKKDLIPKDELAHRQRSFEELLPGFESFLISALSMESCRHLLERMVEMVPTGSQYFPEDEVTDTYERDIAADLIRAACLDLLRQEVPHAIAVRIDEYKDRNEHRAYIKATIFVERDSQKGIVIGRGGRMLCEIGMQARVRIEEMSGRKAYLDLRVKVSPKWRNNREALSRFGYLARTQS